jgi:hypothetical protein
VALSPFAGPWPKADSEGPCPSLLLTQRPGGASWFSLYRENQRPIFGLNVSDQYLYRFAKLLFALM